MDQFTRKTQRTRVFNPAPKAATSIAATGLAEKPRPSLKRTFDEALDVKLQEYLARKAASKKPKLDSMVLQTAPGKGLQPVRKDEVVDRKVMQSSSKRVENSSTFTVGMNDRPQKKIETGTKTEVANRKVMHSSKRRVENPSSFDAAMNTISQKIDRPRKDMAKVKGATKAELANKAVTQGSNKKANNHSSFATLTDEIPQQVDRSQKDRKVMQSSNGRVEKVDRMQKNTGKVETGMKAEVADRRVENHSSFAAVISGISQNTDRPQKASVKVETGTKVGVVDRKVSQSFNGSVESHSSFAAVIGEISQKIDRPQKDSVKAETRMKVGVIDRKDRHSSSGRVESPSSFVPPTNEISQKVSRRQKHLDKMETGMKAEVTDRKVRQSSNGKVQNHSSFAAVICEISQKIDRPQKDSVKAETRMKVGVIDRKDRHSSSGRVENHSSFAAAMSEISQKSDRSQEDIVKVETETKTRVSDSNSMQSSNRKVENSRSFGAATPLGATQQINRLQKVREVKHGSNGTKAVVADSKVVHSSNRRAENSSSFTAALNEISKKVDWSQKEIVKADTEKGFQPITKSKVADRKVTHSVQREAEANKGKAGDIRDTSTRGSQHHSKDPLSKVVATKGEVRHSEHYSTKDKRDESQKAVKKENARTTNCKKDDEVNSLRKESVETNIDKSPRKLILIDIPKQPGVKVAVPNKTKNAELPNNMTEKVKEPEKCANLVRKKPTKSLRERLASGRKFTFPTGPVSNVRRFNTSVIKERLANLTKQNRPVGNDVSGCNKGSVEKEQSVPLAATQQKRESACDKQWDLQGSCDERGKKIEENGVAEQTMADDGFYSIPGGHQNSCPSEVKQSSILSSDESSSSSDSDSSSSEDSSSEDESQSERDEQLGCSVEKDQSSTLSTTQQSRETWDLEGSRGIEDENAVVAEQTKPIDGFCSILLPEGYKNSGPSEVEQSSTSDSNESSSSSSSEDDSDSSSSEDESESEIDKKIAGRNLDALTNRKSSLSSSDDDSDSEDERLGQLLELEIAKDVQNTEDTSVDDIDHSTLPPSLSEGNSFSALNKMELSSSSSYSDSSSEDE